jgi:hypothetical protein
MYGASNAGVTWAPINDTRKFGLRPVRVLALAAESGGLCGVAAVPSFTADPGDAILVAAGGPRSDGAPAFARDLDPVTLAVRSSDNTDSSGLTTCPSAAVSDHGAEWTVYACGTRICTSRNGKDRAPFPVPGPAQSISVSTAHIVAVEDESGAAIRSQQGDDQDGVYVRSARGGDRDPRPESSATKITTSAITSATTATTPATATTTDAASTTTHGAAVDAAAGRATLISKVTVFLGGASPIVALDPETGAQRWGVDLGSHFDQAGYGDTPLVFRGWVHFTFVSGELHSFNLTSGSSVTPFAAGPGQPQVSAPSACGDYMFVAHAAGVVAIHVNPPGPAPGAAQGGIGSPVTLHAAALGTGVLNTAPTCHFDEKRGGYVVVVPALLGALALWWPLADAAAGNAAQVLWQTGLPDAQAAALRAWWRSPSSPTSGLARACALGSCTAMLTVPAASSSLPPSPSDLFSNARRGSHPNPDHPDPGTKFFKDDPATTPGLVVCAGPGPLTAAAFDLETGAHQWSLWDVGNDFSARAMAPLVDAGGLIAVAGKQITRFEPLSTEAEAAAASADLLRIAAVHPFASGEPDVTSFQVAFAPAPGTWWSDPALAFDITLNVTYGSGGGGGKGKFGAGITPTTTTTASSAATCLSVSASVAGEDVFAAAHISTIGAAATDSGLPLVFASAPWAATPAARLCAASAAGFTLTATVRVRNLRTGAVHAAATGTTHVPSRTAASPSASASPWDPDRGGGGGGDDDDDGLSILGLSPGAAAGIGAGVAICIAAVLAWIYSRRRAVRPRAVFLAVPAPVYQNLGGPGPAPQPYFAGN